MRAVWLLVLATACGRLGFAGASDATAGGDSSAADSSPGDTAPGDTAMLVDAAALDAPPMPIAIKYAGTWNGGSQLSRTLATSTSTRIFTFASWYRSMAVGQMLMCAGISATQQSFLWADMTDGRLLIQSQENATEHADLPSVSPWPYSNAWVHVVVSVDLTQATDAQRVRFWFDGVPQTLDPPTTGYPLLPQGQVLYLGGTVAHTIGSKFDGAFRWNGDLAETYIIWGHALDASAFITGTGAQARSISYTGPITAESVHFDYAVPGQNKFAQPNWTASNVGTILTGLPY